MENNLEDRWAAEQIASLEVQWQPDLPQARLALQRRLSLRCQARTWGLTAAAATTAAALLLITLTLPAPRAMAQRLWDRFVLNRIDIVQADLSALPLNMRISGSGLERHFGEGSTQNASTAAFPGAAAQTQPLDLAGAERVAGFRPDMPPPDVLSGAPEITVDAPMVVEQTIRVHDLKTALIKAGASDVEVPVSWDTAILRANVGALVTINYPNAQILETRPIEFSVPADFDLRRFAEAAFRCVGISARDARAMARKFAADPPLLLDVPSGTLVNIKEIPLPSGTVLLEEELDHTNRAVTAATVLWSTPDRLYSVRSASSDLSLKIAASLP